MADTAGPAPIDALLEHRAWIQRVAHALVGDADEAGDLEQDLWVEVLQSPPSLRSSIRGWLASALRNDLVNRRRGDARRAHRELTAARSEAQSSTDELVARAEAADRVMHAVLELAEPYRSVVLARYVEGIELAAIASRGGVPVETVRTRHKRALSMLRTRLSKGVEGDAATWLAAVAPLLRSTFRRSSGSGIGTAGTATLWGGTLVAKKALGALAVLLFVGGTAWFAGAVLSERDSAMSGTASPGPASAAVPQARTPSVQPRAGTRRAPTESAAESSIQENSTVRSETTDARSPVDGVPIEEFFKGRITKLDGRTIELTYTFENPLELDDFELSIPFRDIKTITSSIDSGQVRIKGTGSLRHRAVFTNETVSAAATLTPSRNRDLGFAVTEESESEVFALYCVHDRHFSKTDNVLIPQNMVIKFIPRDGHDTPVLQDWRYCGARGQKPEIARGVAYKVEISRGKKRSRLAIDDWESSGKEGAAEASRDLATQMVALYGHDSDYRADDLVLRGTLDPTYVARNHIDLTKWKGATGR